MLVKCFTSEHTSGLKYVFPSNNQVKSSHHQHSIPLVLRWGVVGPTQGLSGFLLSSYKEGDISEV